jgi:hypothetical protein
MTTTIRLASLLLLLLARSATAADGAGDPCATSSWVLTGASERPEDGTAAFVPSWAPVLDQVAACAQAPALQRACLVVQGHADRVPFRDTMVTALGSQEAAQVARARGRALMVLARLQELGLGAARLREGPPVVHSQVRGVEVRVVAGCTDGGEGQTEEELAALVDRRVAGAIAAHQAHDDEAAPPPAPPGPEEPVGPPPGRFFADGALDATLLAARPTTVFAPALQAGVGWRRGPALVRLGAGVAIGTEPAHRTGFDAALTGAWALGRWELGPQLRYRLASASPGDPWLEQAFALGAQATRCPWGQGGARREVCLTGAVLPLGLRQVRGTVAAGEPVRTAWEARYGVEVLLGMSVRYGL